MTFIRVLLVDDYEVWRIYVRSLLQMRPVLQVVGEASDGAAAVHMSEELKPDLILMDIGLPELNGIDAVRRIRMLCPSSKIVFISQDESRGHRPSSVERRGTRLRLQGTRPKRITARDRRSSDR